ncbi:MAG: hypothetical protein GQ565_05255 [Candidatus Aegiribacteria sp.]|nr:hypothetical protein [Candidatus Aegiribacteria sp.]
MKRIILVALSIAIAGTFAIVQAHEDTLVPDCDNCETVDGECCCGGTVDGCTEDCDSCDSCDCECKEDCTCDTECSCDDCTCDTECDDCSCDDCSSEEEVHHCDGCH